MSQRSERVIAGFMNLGPFEQKEVILAITDYEKSDPKKKAEVKKLQEKKAGIDLGPLGGGGCPCCGR